MERFMTFEKWHQAKGPQNAGVGAKEELIKPNSEYRLYWHFPVRLRSLVALVRPIDVYFTSCCCSSDPPGRLGKRVCNTLLSTRQLLLPFSCLPSYLLTYLGTHKDTRNKPKTEAHGERNWLRFSAVSFVDSLFTSIYRQSMSPNTN